MLRLDEAIMAERKEPERGIGGGRVRRKKGGRKTASARGEADVSAGVDACFSIGNERATAAASCVFWQGHIGVVRSEHELDMP